MAVPGGFTQAANGWLYKLDGSGPYMQAADGTAQQMLGSGMLTNSGGQGARVKVDVAQTSFFMGLGYRFFFRLSLAIGATQTIKIVSPINYVLFQNSVDLIEGELDMSVRIGCTETAAFGTAISVRRINGMGDAPVVISQITPSTGGTVTGGTEINAILVKSSGGLAAGGSAGSSAQDEIGIAAGTTYLVMTAAGGVGAVPVRGVLRYRWEERPTV